MKGEEEASTGGGFRETDRQGVQEEHNGMERESEGEREKKREMKKRSPCKERGRQWQ